MNDLEQQLARQELKRVPADWRDGILSAAASQTKRAPETLPTVWWRALLWPSPRAWAAVGAAWVLVALMQLTMPKVESPGMASAAIMNANPVEAWREQQRLLAELFPPERRAEPSKVLPPRRRSEREPELYFA